MALNGHLMALNGHCAGRHEGGTSMAVRMLAFCHGSIAFLGTLTQYRGRSRLLGREERRSPMRARWTAPTTRDPPEIELGFEYERGNVARVARKGRVGLVCACGIRRVCDHRGQKLCPTRCMLRAVWPSFYQRSNKIRLQRCIRFDSEHLTTSYKRAQAKPKTARPAAAALQSPARARPTRDHARDTKHERARRRAAASARRRGPRSLKRESDPVFLLGPSPVPALARERVRESN